MNPVESYIESFEDHEKRELISMLRHFILSSSPGMHEKMAYGIPFFYRFKNICYINPKSPGVDIGFIKGTQIDFNIPGFELKDRKMVKSLHFKYSEHIDFETLDLILQEAIRLDAEK